MLPATHERGKAAKTLATYENERAARLWPSKKRLGRPPLAVHDGGRGGQVVASHDEEWAASHEEEGVASP